MPFDDARAMKTSNSGESANEGAPVNGTLRQRLDDAIAQVNALVLGKPDQIKLAFACLLTGGHLLLEDLPGTGKTILARSLASAVSLEFRRVQFTSDLMPGDILGVSVFRPDTREFELHKGPVFTNILLADEINRASPRTQSALLEAMAENQVSIDRQTLRLPQPFLVLATQNPLDSAGTYPLPDAQRDRFLFQLSLGYPGRESEIALMRAARRSELLDQKRSAAHLDASDLMALREQVRSIHVSDEMLGYIFDLVEGTRQHAKLMAGLSPRASLALVEAAQALAFLAKRTYATPEDVREAFLPLARHRVHGKDGYRGQERGALEDVLEGTPAP